MHLLIWGQLGPFETAVCCYFAFSSPSLNIQVVMFTELVAQRALRYLQLYQRQCWIKAQEYRVEPPDSNTQRVPAWFSSGGHRKAGWESVNKLHESENITHGLNGLNIIGRKKRENKTIRMRKLVRDVRWTPVKLRGYQGFHNLSFWLPFIPLLPCLHVSTNVF